MDNTKKILIVEDERLTAKSLMYDLIDLGYYALDPVAKGEDAVVVALEKDPDLIMMDIRLAGGLDGIEAAERILEKKAIPIVYMTGYATDFIKERAMGTHPIGFLEKPVEMDRVKEIVDSL